MGLREPVLASSVDFCDFCYTGAICNSLRRGRALVISKALMRMFIW
jgi:hypothetical protein